MINPIHELARIFSENKFLQKVKTIALWTWDKPLWPLRKLLRKALPAYKRLWTRITFPNDKFSPKRALLFILGSLGALFFLYLLIPGLINITFNSFIYALTSKTETVYLYLSEEIYPDENIWSVKGCRETSCDLKSSIYYRIKPSAFNHLISVFTQGSLFLPDALGSSVPTGTTLCDVKAYGFRYKSLARWDVYPNIISIKCNLKPIEGEPI